jgi:hypothetical protein
LVIPDETEVETGDVEEELSKLNQTEDIKELVQNDIEAIRNGEDSIIVKWYGMSDIFTPEFIANTSSRVIVNFIDSELQPAEVRLHLCAVQYSLVEEDMKKLAEEYDEPQEISNIVANKILNGDYSKCYNVTVSVNADGIVPTEELKVVMSGGAYKTVEVEETECLVKNEKDEHNYE